MSRRTERVASTIQQELAQIIMRELEELGIPFVFTTGYGRVDARWASHSVVQKPFDIGAIEGALRKALAV